MPIPAAITKHSITFFANGKPWTLSSDSANFGRLKEMLTAGQDADVSELISLVDKRAGFVMASGGALDFRGSQLTFEGKTLSSTWQMVMTACFEARPAGLSGVIAACRDAYQNPTSSIRDRIPDAGTTLAYMSDGQCATLHVVRSDLTDVKTGTIRFDLDAEVSAAENRPLSIGANGYMLHEKFSFRSMAAERRLLIVTFWPRHVVGIPGDPTGKVRLSQCRVVGEIDPTDLDGIRPAEVFGMTDNLHAAA